jgi:rhamnulokinase
MPLKIQEYCKRTNQPVPRKPGAIFRCILESLALQYRIKLLELEALTGRDVERLYLLGRAGHTLLNHFIASAMQIPVVVAPPEATAIGNVLVQAVAIGDLKSIDEAREVVRNSFNSELLIPRGTAWESSFERFLNLCLPENSRAA